MYTATQYYDNILTSDWRHAQSLGDKAPPPSSLQSALHEGQLVYRRNQSGLPAMYTVWGLGPVVIGGGHPARAC